MKRFREMIMIAGCLLGAAGLCAQEQPTDIGTDTEAAAKAGIEAAAKVELPAEFTAKAHAARELLTFPTEQFSLRWLREEVDPFQRARRKLREAMLARAREQESVIRTKGSKRDLNKEVSIWRLNIGNTSVNNWSPYQDRALDARALSFPLPRGTRADKRTDQQKALDKMKLQKR